MYLDRAKFTALFPGIPSWMQGMDMGWDFVRNVSFRSAPAVTDTHSATIYAQYQNGSFALFAANTLVDTDLGLQTVPTRTNLALRSQTFTNLSWVKTGATAVDNTTTAPDGTSTAGTLTPDTGLTTHRMHQDYTSTAAVYAISLFVKPNGYSKVAIREDAVLGAYVAFDLSGNGSVMGSGGGGTPAGTISAHANGWFRIVMTYTGSAATNRPTLYVMDAGYTSGAPNAYSYTGNGTSGVFVWQGQYELGAFATPPIVTTSSTATVNGNQQVVDLTGRLSAGVGGILQINALAVDQSVQALAFNNGTGNEFFMIDYGSSSGPRISTLSTVGADGAAQSAQTLANAAGLVTIAFATSSGYQRIQAVGGTSQVLAKTLPTLTRMNIGGLGYSASSNKFQIARRLALRFGVQSDATFADLFAKATLLAAVS